MSLGNLRGRLGVGLVLVNDEVRGVIALWGLELEELSYEWICTMI